jgi:glycerate 2-kinase
MAKPVAVAPDSFKGTLSSPEVAAAIGRGLKAGGVQPVLLPAGDGGEGTLEVLLQALGGDRRKDRAHDPLGREIEAEWGLLSDGRAVVEVAAASGLNLLSEGERDPEAASSAGTGELIAAAAAEGSPTILVAAGGSATTDGGRGAIDAIEAAGGLGEARLEVICDVSIPFERAAEMFAPQKGADPATVARLGERLTAVAGTLPRDPRGRAMTSAAGGLSGGLWAAFGARLVPGAAYVLGVIGFDRALDGAGAVVTGEGRLDEQSFEGKLVGQLARRCRSAGVPLHAIAGQVAIDDAELPRRGLASAAQAGTPAEIEARAEALSALLA